MTTETIYVTNKNVGINITDGKLDTNAAVSGAITNAVIGSATSDAAVVTDATGSIHQYLRGLVKLLVAKVTVILDAGTNLVGKVGIDQATANANEVVVKSGSITTTRTSLTASAPTYATVGVASAEAVAANANRKGLVLVNTSANYISLAIGAAAVLYSGITLAPWGTWVMDEYTFTTGQIRAIASGAGSNLAIQEYATV